MTAATNRGHTPLSTAVLAAGLALLVAWLAGCSRPAPSKNLLLITVDTLRADHLGAYGNTGDLTPRLDELARSGVVFEDAQSTSSWTLPALASLMTSSYSSGHGCWSFDSVLDDSFATLAEQLARSGHATSGIASHVFLRPKHGLAQGFETFDTSLVKRLMESHESISSPEITERAQAWLHAWDDSEDQRPFFLWAHYFDPHEVYQAHPGHSERLGVETDEQRYQGEVAFTDHWIGALLDTLDEMGLREDTIVAVAADHGEEFGDHGRKRHGHTLYRELIHVPFIFRVPGVEPGRCEELVSLVDFAPTVLELMGVPAWEGMEGRSLVPLLEGESLAERPVLSEVRLREGRHFESVITQDRKLIVRADGRVELYDRNRDAGEVDDLSETESAEELRHALDSLREDSSSLAVEPGASARLELSAEELQGLSQLGYTDEDR